MTGGRRRRIRRLARGRVGGRRRVRRGRRRRVRERSRIGRRRLRGPQGAQHRNCRTGGWKIGRIDDRNRHNPAQQVPEPGREPAQRWRRRAGAGSGAGARRRGRQRRVRQEPRRAAEVRRGRRVGCGALPPGARRTPSAAPPAPRGPGPESFQGRRRCGRLGLGGRRCRSAGRDGRSGGSGALVAGRPDDDGQGDRQRGDPGHEDRRHGAADEQERLTVRRLGWDLDLRVSRRPAGRRRPRRARRYGPAGPCIRRRPSA